jgi:hypothetical protein
MTIEQILFHISDALLYPVLLLALLALVVVLAEVGTLLAELRRRRGRSVARLERAADVARDALAAAGDGAGTLRAVRSVGFNPAMDEALGRDRSAAAGRSAPLGSVIARETLASDRSN